VLYADASVIVSAYLADEPDHAEWHARLFEGEDPVVVSEVARVEVTSAIAAASRAGRLDDGPMVIARFEADCATGGPINLLALRSGPVMERAARLTQEHRLRSLDAIHLAVALEDARPLADEGTLVFATRDRHQSSAARKLGLRVA
jgi:predicted nucleic acid-binding protein